MLRGRSFRVTAAIMAIGGLLVGAGSSLAAISGSYNGSGKGFTIGFDVQSDHVDNLEVSCGRGAITVEAMGVAPKVKNDAFTYSGLARSTNRSKTIHMTVTGTFADRGKKVKGTASTSGACKSGSYTASK
jgi:hypothetical protein